MRTMGLLCAAFAAAALAGCGGRTTIMGADGNQMLPSQTYKCTLNDDCMISVKVVTTGDTCKVTINPDLDIELNSNGLSRWVSHNIRWVLDDDSQDANYRFADEPKGVVLKDPNADPETGGQFFQKRRLNKGREYQWRDHNSNTQYYGYTINIIQKGTNRACPLDPRIWNN